MEMDRRQFLGLLAGFVAVALGPTLADSKEKAPLLFLPGYGNTPESPWFKKTKLVLADNYGIKADMLSLPAVEVPDRNLCLQKTYEAVMSYPGQVSMVGFSLGAGLLEMFFDSYHSSLDNNKIPMAVFISGRDLYRYDPSEIPDQLQLFYQPLTNPEKILEKVRDIRVAYGLREAQAFIDGGEELAASLGVVPHIFDVDHGGIVENPCMLSQVVR